MHIQEINIEGLVYTDYYLWFVGSHRYKCKKPKPENTDAKNFKRLAKIESEPNPYLLGRMCLSWAKINFGSYLWCASSATGILDW
ncbi:DUF3616 domain-containing protein [Nostoc sp.]|uniref:DUF3616 domain-containing protein n=1 Tax=Nostoc sp. TaxID=1180 RepID=UPI002FF5C691